MIHQKTNFFVICLLNPLIFDKEYMKKNHFPFLVTNIIFYLQAYLKKNKKYKKNKKIKSIFMSFGGFDSKT